MDVEAARPFPMFGFNRISWFVLARGFDDPALVPACENRASTADV